MTDQLNQNRDCRKLVLTGRVQGVGFRFFVYSQAQKLGITGWVRNLNNGDVEVHVEGEVPAVEQFSEAVRRGPSMAFVSGLQSRVVPCEGFDDFTIRR